MKSIVEKMNGSVIVVSSKDEADIVPLFCYLCKHPMKTADDALSYRKHGVCSKCDGRWTNYPGVDWQKEELPDFESEDWAEYINERSLLARPLITFK